MTVLHGHQPKPGPTPGQKPPVPTTGSGVRPTRAAEPPQGSLWRHAKTGHVYAIVGFCTIEANVSRGVLYRYAGLNEDPAGLHTWLRPLAEFLDGRFHRLAPEPAPVAAVADLGGLHD
ncbi:hypothetical protein DFR50_15913 [Roseiarcus fermentans]|uniref:DUF1653 domain-containing protein n=1 Tax=Roseiarcus fermentans TaxID=1473586 RepID=A0A366EFG7_9HYPH|nr:hypothetical protein [Roseiarcus fermentans]RBP01068.1 hypothetical protein DFR50_15913 [Roseiarcus fermentans]